MLSPGSGGPASPTPGQGPAALHGSTFTARTGVAREDETQLRVFVLPLASGPPTHLCPGDLPGPLKATVRLLPACTAILLLLHIRKKVLCHSLKKLRPNIDIRNSHTQDKAFPP